MKKTVLAALVSATCFSAVADTAPVTIYGKLNLALQSEDHAGTDGNEIAVRSHHSRLGVKGGVELTDSLSAVYKMEFKVNVDQNDKNNDNIGARNQYVGLKGGFGEVVVGRKDSATKSSQGGIDLFGDIDGDIAKLFRGENRLDNSISYSSPSLNGFKAAATYVTDEASSQKGDDGFSGAISYGDSKLKKRDFFLSAAIDSKVKGFDVLRATGYYQLGDLRIGGMIQNQEDTETNDDQTGYLANLAYKIDAFTLKAQYQFMEDLSKGGYLEGNDASVINLGVDYKLGKPTKLYAVYTLRDWDDAKFENDAGDLIDEESYLGLGMIHLF